ncbi:PREDICTED: PEST proteolytic signal-containing nuclear protein [Chaetura pelagica]|uniref:PEST proteolytic signal-containing nuclear protein n=1 Tax=Chaetura pelagica TaxID=8897 RepID=UPI000523D4E0|nr:PREDICTED: PEST proteolytic signal-containing nuclear protein [Chaetura pelagica]
MAEGCVPAPCRAPGTAEGCVPAPCRAPGTAEGCVPAPGRARRRRDPGPEEEAEKPVKTKTVSSSNGGESSSRSAEKRAAKEEAEDFTTKPAPAKMSKFGFSIGSQTAKKASAISIKLGSSKPKEPVPTLAPKTLSVAAAFNEDEDSEPEEMPPEAKMRMKNIGRDTPTSAGPNSFNKGKHGFSDNQKLWERNIKSHLGNVHDQENN